MFVACLAKASVIGVGKVFHCVSSPVVLVFFCAVGIVGANKLVTSCTRRVDSFVAIMIFLCNRSIVLVSWLGVVVHPGSATFVSRVAFVIGCFAYRQSPFDGVFL